MPLDMERVKFAVRGFLENFYYLVVFEKDMPLNSGV
jgi:hypothetical protein